MGKKAYKVYTKEAIEIAPSDREIPIVKRKLTASKSKKNEIVLLEGLNHLFQESKTGLVSEYPQIEQTFAPKALEVISNWILKQTKRLYHEN
ncbi:hypothetical protein MM213_17280 [Belliella sp. R4-6]|uniref:Uncharacterized protein n=1 Tax=Belliella alkalica TaxID=1730871 RepID=A0ABS9VFM7_9BACT|nr:hypothetical protein [Belliella alkalica]MCH7415256.1 hypothetical protein [Belliella alkalica]